MHGTAHNVVQLLKWSQNHGPWCSTDADFFHKLAWWYLPSLHHRGRLAPSTGLRQEAVLVLEVLLSTPSSFLGLEQRHISPLQQPLVRVHRHPRHRRDRSRNTPQRFRVSSGRRATHAERLVRLVRAHIGLLVETSFPRRRDLPRTTPGPRS